MFTIANPEFEKHIPDIYSPEPQLCKANTSNVYVETPFLNLNIKVLVIENNINTSVYVKRDDFVLLTGNLPGLILTSLDSNLTVSTFLNLFNLLCVALVFRAFILKIVKLLLNR